MLEEIVIGNVELSLDGDKIKIKFIELNYDEEGTYYQVTKPDANPDFYFRPVWEVNRLREERREKEREDKSYFEALMAIIHTRGESSRENSKYCADKYLEAVSLLGELSKDFIKKHEDERMKEVMENVYREAFDFFNNKRPYESSAESEADVRAAKVRDAGSIIKIVEQTKKQLSLVLGSESHIEELSDSVFVEAMEVAEKTKGHYPYPSGTYFGVGVRARDYDEAISLFGQLPEDYVRKREDVRGAMEGLYREAFDFFTKNPSDYCTLRGIIKIVKEAKRQLGLVLCDESYTKDLEETIKYIERKEERDYLKYEVRGH